MKKTILMLGLLVLVTGCSSLLTTSGRINADAEFLIINQTDSVEILETNLSWEDIPNNATYCYPKNNYEESCQWIKGSDNKYHELCINDLVYREICFTKIEYPNNILSNFSLLTIFFNLTNTSLQQ